MASNAFGNLFRVTTWGESHGKALGAVVDGCPPGIEIDESFINQELMWRRPGAHAFTSPRQESDQVEILSGVFDGRTTGAPISLLIWNRDARSEHYSPIKNLLRPGHAQFTYLKKFGAFDYRGGGRASGRETVCRVAAGAIAKKILSDLGVFVVAFVHSIGSVEQKYVLSDVKDPLSFQQKVRGSAVFCPDATSASQMEALLEEALKEQDSIGGVVGAVAFRVPAGWGDPVYEKLHASLAKAMLSIPAARGFEVGEGFAASKMRGSHHNDLFEQREGELSFVTNRCGGVLGGISTGMPIFIRVAFKPTSSIAKNQPTVNLKGEPTVFSLPKGSRHDPCIAIRAVPVVEAMFASALVDAYFMHRAGATQTVPCGCISS